MNITLEKIIFKMESALLKYYISTNFWKQKALGFTVCIKRKGIQFSAHPFSSIWNLEKKADTWANILNRKDKGYTKEQ